MTTSENGLSSQSAHGENRGSLLSRKVVGVCIVAVFAAAIMFGGVHYALEVIEATSGSGEGVPGEQVPRLATDPYDDPAVAALKYVCLFH